MKIPEGGSGSFGFCRGAEGQIPVLVEVPHSGLGIPEEVRSQLLLGQNTVLRDADSFVDALYAGAVDEGASLLTAKLSRYVVDLNRAAHDIDRRELSGVPVPPVGVVWRVSATGKRLLKAGLTEGEIDRRVDAYYRPYHRRLAGELHALRVEFGYAIGIAAHSMPSYGRGVTGRRERRADVVPGTLGGASAAPEIIDAIDAHFRDAGLSVRHNEPYRGGFSTAHYGRPESGQHMVQIELNRAIYMDEGTLMPKEPEFEELQGVLTSLVRVLGEVEVSPRTES